MHYIWMRVVSCFQIDRKLIHSTWLEKFCARGEVERSFLFSGNVNTFHTQKYRAHVVETVCNPGHFSKLWLDFSQTNVMLRLMNFSFG